ncbi:MAG TPA: hypothetical protein VFM54_20395 [Micromonosporaceae bacterium]|nr:hypothetical protein [Micromonosporaceae bacterium]
MSTRQQERDEADPAVPGPAEPVAADAAEPGQVRSDQTGPGRDAAGETGTTEGAGTGGSTPGDRPGQGEGPHGEDRWSRFAPAPEPVPGRIRRLAARAGWLTVHEWTLACLGGLVLAVVMTWPTLADPWHTLPRDLGDPTLVAWMLAWSGHALRTDPGQLWHSNAFFPEPYSFAFTESLLGYAPFGLIGTGPEAATLRYNIIFVLSHALAFIGAYALVRQLGAGRTGATLAAVAFVYAPWRLAQTGHLHVISTGGIVLSMAMLARGHGWSLRHGYRPARRRAGWVVAGWLVAAWQVTVGIGISVPFAYALALVAAVAAVGWLVRGRPPVGWRVLAADTVGGAVFAATCLLVAQPYLKVLELHPYAQRDAGDVALFSSPLRGFFVAPPDSLIWGDLHEPARALLTWHPEMTLLPGFALYGIAAAGLVFSIWRIHVRLLLAGGVLATIALGMGTMLGGDGRPGYLTLHDHLYGWDALRTPGRLVMWTTLLLGILAAGAVCAFVERARELTAGRVPPGPGPLLRLASLVPLVLVLLEGTNQTPHEQVAPAPAALRSVAGPLLVLPSDGYFDMTVMLWSTGRFEPMVNGGSSFTPARQAETRRLSRTFPDAESVERLRDLGVRTVVLLPERAAGTPWQHAATIPVDGLGITREEVDGAVVFRLDP